MSETIQKKSNSDGEKLLSIGTCIREKYFMQKVLKPTEELS